jgi:hypothetical protein
MSRPAPERTIRGGPVRVAVALLLAVAVLLPLLVGVYDREDPTLLGFPFYYWYQFALIPLTAVLTIVSFRLITRQEDKERAEGRRGTREGGRS